MTVSGTAHAVCSGCGGANPWLARFCNQCGVPLPPVSVRSERSIEAERRQITVMFADLVGSTAMAHDLDAEDFHDLVKEYWALCDEVVADLDGQVHQRLGDGVMAYFGHPTAHEDDARRAIDAAVGILARVAALNDRLKLDLPVKPSVRVGIHSGITVIGRDGTALGETPNLASRLQQLADPGSIVISEVTRKLSEGYFHVESLGPQSVKGLSEPMAVYRVTGSTGAQTRVGATGPRLTPLIGRDEEALKLASLWEASLGGSPQIAIVSGEPGIGKSRLAQGLKQMVGTGSTVLEGYCSPLHENTVLRAVAQALETALGLGDLPDAASKLTRLEEHVRKQGLDDDVRDLVAPVLSLPVPKNSPTIGLTPAVKRQRTMQALVAYVRSLAKAGPVLFVIEDIHWADPSTLEFLHGYADGVTKDPMMLLVTARPEAASPWPAEVATTIVLPRLPPEMAEQVVDRVALGRRLPREVRDRVINLTDGVPLYLEEVTRAVLESGALRLVGQDYDLSGAIPEALVPATVHDSLTARLDRLGECKAVAQLAAILGREFTDDVLRAVSLMDDAELNAGLRQLAESGLLLAEERGGRRAYRFKHALIQEAARDSLPKSRRRQYHHRVASVLRDQFPELSEAQPDVIAQHHAKADLPELASTYFERAGGNALAAQAYAESISHQRSALLQIKKLPAGGERDSRELRALAALGLPLLMTKGYAADEVETTYERAQALCAEVDPPMRILFGVWGVQLVRGNRENTERMAKQFRRIADTSRNPAEKLISLAAVGSHAFWRGDFTQAIPSLKGAVKEFEPEMLAVLPRDYGYDNALYGHLYLAWAQNMAGQLAEGRATWDELWDITERSRAPYLSALSLSFGAAMARDLGENDRALELSARGIELATEHQLAFWLALARLQHGSALCRTAKVVEGTLLIEQGLGFCRAIGVRTPLSYYLSYLADAHFRSGETQKGLDVVAEGLDLAESHIDRSGLVELLRLKGELLMQLGAGNTVVEAAFERAIEIGRIQGSGLWELTTATSLARMLGRAGQTERARGLLASALERVTGGEPPIVKEARTLLAELGNGSTLKPD